MCRLNCNGNRAPPASSRLAQGMARCKCFQSITLAIFIAQRGSRRAVAMVPILDLAARWFSSPRIHFTPPRRESKGSSNSGSDSRASARVAPSDSVGNQHGTDPCAAIRVANWAGYSTKSKSTVTSSILRSNKQLSSSSFILTAFTSHVELMQ